MLIKKGILSQNDAQTRIADIVTELGFSGVGVPTIRDQVMELGFAGASIPTIRDQVIELGFNVLFNPLDLPTRLRWWSARDESTITSNMAGKISQWRDKSGNAGHLNQAVGAQQLTTGITVNGKNAIAVRNEVMPYQHSIALTAEYNIFMSYTAHDNVPGYRCFMETYSNRHTFCNNALAGSTNIAYSSVATVNGMMHFHKPASGVGAKVYNNGSIILDTSDTAYNDTTADNIMIFDDITGGNTIYLNICDILITGAVTATEKEKIEGWMMHDIGQQSLLPALHPYKLTPPLA